LRHIWGDGDASVLPFMTSKCNTLQSSAPRLLYPRKEAAFQLGLSVRNLDYRILKGTIRARRVGSRVLVPHEELVKFASRDHGEVE
jgi:excisionase family DNA binding protein